MYFGIKDAANVTFRSPSNNNVLFYFDYANTFGISLTSESQYATAKGTNKISWSGNKNGTLTMSAQVIPNQMLALMAGAVESVANTEVFKREVLTVDSGTGTVTLTDNPTIGSLSIFLVEDDLRTHKQQLTAGTPASNPNEYSIVGKVITANTSQKGKKVVVYYTTGSVTQAMISKIKANVFASPVRINAVSTVRTDVGVDKLVQISCLGTPQSNFDINFDSSNASTFDFTFDLVADVSDDLVTLEFI